LVAASSSRQKQARGNVSLTIKRQVSNKFQKEEFVSLMFQQAFSGTFDGVAVRHISTGKKYTESSVTSDVFCPDLAPFEFLVSGCFSPVECSSGRMRVTLTKRGSRGDGDALDTTFTMPSSIFSCRHRQQ
jgi:hypothetical protein